jgi:hypothetical protein
MDAFRHHGAMEKLLGDRFDRAFPVTGKSDFSAI